ncbi:MAG: alpha/beta hydrolase [Chloroflexota bacterium]|nr:alpha/beta hydrolase [Chloroflexota bacterium]
MKLIFIHGSGSCGDAWHYQTKHFPDADAVSLPGHPDGEPRTSIEGYVDWLRDYIRRQSYRDVVLAGHSLGSAIAQLHALEHADDLKALILIGAGARLRVHPMYIEALEKARTDPSIMETMTQANDDLVEPDYAEMMRRRSLQIGPAVFLNDMLCCDRFDVMDRVHQIKLPTLVVCGTEDVMTPPKYARYLTDKIEGSTEVIIPGGTHRVFAEKPDEVNRAIDEFVQRLPS